MTCEKCVYFYYFRHHFIDGRTAIIFDIISLFCFRTLIHDEKKNACIFCLKAGNFFLHEKLLSFQCIFSSKSSNFNENGNMWEVVEVLMTSSLIDQFYSVAFHSCCLFASEIGRMCVFVRANASARAHAHATTLAYSFQTNVSDQVID